MGRLLLALPPSNGRQSLADVSCAGWFGGQCTGSGAVRAGAIFLPAACVRWRDLGLDKGARAGVAHRRRCATPGGGVVCYRAGTLPPVRDAGLAGAGQSTCARLVPRILGPWHLVPARRRGCGLWLGLCAGDRAALVLARRPRAGTAGAVRPFGSRVAAVLPCVPACRPSRADGGDTGFESRNRCHLLI